jgi:hypothetical protein
MEFSENSGKPEKLSLTKEELEEANNHFFSWVDLPKKERKITEIFKKHQSKFSKENKALFLHPIGHVYEPEDFRKLFQYEKHIPIPIKKEYNFIYDCLNFVCYANDLTPSLNEEEYKNKIIYDFSLLNEKGTLMILLDVYFLKNFFDNLVKALGDEYKIKLFINFYFMEKHDFLFVVTIQKMAKVDTPINLQETKVLITDYFSNLHSHLLCSKPIKEINTYLEEMVKKMQSYFVQCKLNFNLLNVLRPGKFFEMRIKTSPLNPGVDFIVTITDNSQNLDKKNVKTIAIVILYEMSQELVFQSNMSFDMMTHMLNVGRLITLQCALLNPMNMNEIAFELSEDIEKMRPAQFRDRISVQGWEDKNPKYLVDQGNTYLIRDCEEKPEQIFRQLYYTTDNNIINAIMAKIKIKYVSKSKIKNNNQYFPMETQDKFKNKGVIKCIDENNIPGFYEKSIICMAFYLDLDNFPKNTIKIMDIGAGLGIMSFYLYKLFKGNCEVDNIEKNKWIYEVGLKSFGLKNYYSNNNRINWFLEDAQTCMNKMIDSYKNETKYENKIDFYDLIINEVNDIIPKEYCSPPVSNFTDEFLGNIKLLLKKNGVFIVNIQTRNFKVLYENYKQIDKYFPTCCVIPSESSLCYIFICFNQILSEESYSERFQINKEKILKGNVIDSNLVEPFYRDVISKIKSVKEEIKKMEDNSKKI